MEQGYSPTVPGMLSHNWIVISNHGLCLSIIHSILSQRETRSITSQSQRVSSENSISQYRLEIIQQAIHLAPSIHVGLHESNGSEQVVISFDSSLALTMSRMLKLVDLRVQRLLNSHRWISSAAMLREKLSKSYQLIISNWFLGRNQLNSNNTLAEATLFYLVSGIRQPPRSMISLTNSIRSLILHQILNSLSPLPESVHSG